MIVRAGTLFSEVARVEGSCPAPKVKDGKREESKVERAAEARRLGAKIREGKPVTFRPVVGRIR